MRPLKRHRGRWEKSVKNNQPGKKRNASRKKRKTRENDGKKPGDDELGSSTEEEEAEAEDPFVSVPYQRFEVIKSPVDARNYLVVKFNNGLKCCLISNYRCENDIDHNLPLESRTSTFQEVYDFNRHFLRMYGPGSSSEVSDHGQMSLLEKVAKYPWQESLDMVSDVQLEENEWWEPPRKRKNHVCPCPPPEVTDGYGISMAVTLGCLHDPLEVTGLAHLLEHCLFLETKTYKEPWSFLSNNSATANAATEMDHTFYYATMDCIKEFIHSLKAFGEMFTCPILSLEQVAHEVDNVDSENCIKLSRDFLRVGSLFLLFSRTNHHMTRFGMGDRTSLDRNDIGHLIRNHFTRYYRGNYMNLCVQAPLPMEELIQITANQFHNVKSTNQPTAWEEIQCEGFPFDMKKFSRIYKVQPFKNVQWMIFSWVMTPSCWLNHETKPLEYVAALFSLRGKSTLDHYLKAKGWVTCCASSFSSESQEQDACYITNLFYSGIHLGLEVTSEGLLHENDIYRAVFAYLSMWKKVGPKRRIFNEFRTLRAHRYHYRTCMEKSCIDIALSLSKPRHPKFVLTAPDLLTTYDPDAIKFVLDQLRPRQTNVVIVSRMYESIVTTVDPISLVTYTSCSFPPELLVELEGIQPYNDFEIPGPNPYISEKICRPLEGEIGGMSVENHLAYLRFSGKAAMECQHKSNKVGLLNYSIYTFEFTSPLCRANPHNCVMIFLWKKILKEKIQERIHEAIRADVVYGIYDGESGLLISLEGPSQWLPTVWLDVLDEFVHFEKYLDEMTFLLYKDLHLKIFENANLRYDTHSFAEDLLLYLTTNQYVLMSVLSNYLRYYVTFEEFLKFTKNYKTRMWVLSQLVGCISYSELNVLASSITRLEYDALQEEEICVNHIQEIPLGEKCLRVKAMASTCVTSTTWNYYQMGHLRPDEEEILPTLAKLLSTFMFTQLRSMEQLSYYVKVESDLSFSVASLSVVLVAQADKFKPSYVDERIDSAFVIFYEQHMARDEQIRSLFLACKTPRNQDRELIKGIMASPGFPDMVREMYKKHLPHKCDHHSSLPTFRKLSVQVQGSPRFKDSIPKEPKYIEMKRGLYETPDNAIHPDCIQRIQGKIALDIPEDMEHSNAYFITHLENFKLSMRMYPTGGAGAD